MLLSYIDRRFVLSSCFMCSVQLYSELLVTLFILHTVNAGKGMSQIGVGLLPKLTRTGLFMDVSIN